MFLKLIKISRGLRNRESSRSKASFGFTLIEVAIVMVILALLVMAAVKYGPVYVANNRVRSATETFRAALGIARSEATKRNRLVDLVIDTSGNGSWRVQDQGLPPEIIRTGSLVDHQGVTGTFSTATTLTFDAFGRSLGGGPNFDFGSNIGTCQSVGGEIRCLRVTLGTGGVATVCDPAMSYAVNSGGCKP